MAAHTTKDTINLLLVGKTGVGKSSTGNTIIGQKRFQSAATQGVVTKECQAEYAHVLGRKVKVVDLPGLADPALDDTEDVTTVIDEVMTAVAETPEGYDAILIVITYGRQTKEETKVMAQLKAILGDKFIAEFGILLITHADQFDPEENNNQTIEEWCSSEKGILSDLLKECRGRVVFFVNKSTDLKVKNSQLEHLLSTVNKMKSGLRYLPKHFKDAQAEREKLLVKSQEERVLDKITKPTRLIMNDLDGINVEENPEAAIQILQGLSSQIKELRQEVISEDKGTGVLGTALNMIKSVEQAVLSKFHAAENVKKKRNLQNQLANTRAKTEEEQQKLRQQLKEKDRQMQESAQKQKQEREEAERKYKEFVEKQNAKRRSVIKKVLVAGAVVLGIPALVAGAVTAVVLNPGLLPVAAQALRVAAPVVIGAIAKGTELARQ